MLAGASYAQAGGAVPDALMHSGCARPAAYVVYAVLCAQDSYRPAQRSPESISPSVLRVERAQHLVSCVSNVDNGLLGGKFRGGRGNNPPNPGAGGHGAPRVRAAPEQGSLLLIVAIRAPQ